MAMRTRRRKAGDPNAATITTVAAKANVATMTVSRVINGGYAVVSYTAMGAIIGALQG